MRRRERKETRRDSLTEGWTPMSQEFLIAFGLAVLLANIATLGLNLKIYTEVMKERAQQRRAEEKK